MEFDKMELEQKAEKYLKENCCDFCVMANDCKEDIITCGSKDCFISGYKQGFEQCLTTKEMADAYIAELERLLRLYAGCNVCRHFVDFDKCDIGGKCDGKKWGIKKPFVERD